MLREQLALSNARAAKAEAEIAKAQGENVELKAKVAFLEAGLEAERKSHSETKEKYDRLKKEHEERVFLFRGIEYRSGRRTNGEWLAFCPKCSVVLHVDDNGYYGNGKSGPVCAGGCGWKSPIPWCEICIILENMNDPQEAGVK